MIVSHREPRVDHFKRLPGGQWLSTTYTVGGAVQLAGLGDSISVDEVYSGVSFDEGRSRR